MRIFLSIMMFLFFIGAWREISFAQDTTNYLEKDIQKIKKTFEPPDDILAETQNKVDQLKQTPGTFHLAQDTDKPEQRQEGDFKNPFIPQTPRSSKQVTTLEPAETTPAPTLEQPVAPPPQFTVSGLVWNTKKPAAIVNGKIVAVGDEVSSWSVSEITKEGVRVTFEDQNLWVKPIVDPNNSAHPN